MWVCPHCKLTLQASPDNAVLACANGHSFDRAREGYVNLLPPNRRGSRQPGDNPQMVAARRRVHDAQLYKPLADAVVAELLEHAPVGEVLELGCGEGYYCDALALAGGGCEVLGVDISRAAVRLAARRCKAGRFAVASAYDLPLPDASVAAVVRVFAPSDDAEVVRILRPGGFYLEVSPGPRHLWQLRALLYDRARENTPARLDVGGLQLCSRQSVEYVLDLTREQLLDVVAMTPFAHRGHREKRAELQISELTAMDMSFALHLFQRTAD